MLCPRRDVALLPVRAGQHTHTHTHRHPSCYPSQEEATLTSFPDCSKIASRSGQSLATPWSGEGSHQEPVTAAHPLPLSARGASACLGFAFQTRSSLLAEDATKHRQARRPAGILPASLTDDLAPLLVPHKYYLSFAPGAAGQLCK